MRRMRVPWRLAISVRLSPGHIGIDHRCQVRQSDIAELFAGGIVTGNVRFRDFLNGD
jgi:hypothetical protein